MYDVFVVCCVVECCFIGLLYVYVLLLSGFVFVCFVCGVNAFPVCDCVLYVPSLRCSSMLV